MRDRNVESIANRDALRRLIQLNFDVGGAGQAALRDRDWKYIETLALKVARHAASAYWLAQAGTRLSPDQPGDMDWPSIQVLCRACVEAFLTLDYLYIDASDRDIAEFRYCSWMIAGFVGRQSYPVLDERGQAQLRLDVKFLDRTRRRLRKNNTFSSLKPKHQKKVIEGRKWPVDTTLTQLARKAFGPELGGAIYSYLSAHAHSTALSAVQVRDNTGSEQERDMADGALWLVGQVVAKTTAAYASRFVYARKALEKHPDKWLNDIWTTVSEVPLEAFRRPE
jgi:hypothetical protein